MSTLSCPTSPRALIQVQRAFRFLIVLESMIFILFYFPQVQRFDFSLYLNQLYLFYFIFPWYSVRCDFSLNVPHKCACGKIIDGSGRVSKIWKEQLTKQGGCILSLCSYIYMNACVCMHVCTYIYSHISDQYHSRCMSLSPSLPLSEYVSLSLPPSLSVCLSLSSSLSQCMSLSPSLPLCHSLCVTFLMIFF
jgi:hypothetical protein